MESDADGSEDDDGSDSAEAKALEAVNDHRKDHTTKKKQIWQKEGQAKPKKKKFRYESKAERQATRQKQKSKNHKAKLRRTGK